MFNYTAFNHYDECEMKLIAEYVWNFLLTEHTTNEPSENFGDLIKLLLEKKQSRILLE